MSAVIAAGVSALLLGVDGGWTRLSGADLSVLLLLAYLFPYLVITTVTFSTASPERVRTWARRSTRGTLLQRYVFGTAPGPGVSLFIAVAALTSREMRRTVTAHSGIAFVFNTVTVASLVSALDSI
ncbi:hypothetical protein [Streptomyces flaveolus]|uniref:hypothetical protein n=1 Tax=Streptomyces flaveolus TaxID=67297 RepID=UPI003691A648